MPTQIQLRRGASSEWTSANPVLAEGEMGVELDTMFYKIGDGVTHWTNLSYATVRNVTSLTMADMLSQSTPSTPADGHLEFYAKLTGGRMLPQLKGPDGVETWVQTSIAQNFITAIFPSSSTTVSILGMGNSSAGTISHPGVSEIYGYAANFVTAGTASAPAGTGGTNAHLFRGSVPGGSNGFFFFCRLGFPDSTYDQAGASTGSRFFVGLTSGTMLASVSVDTLAGHNAGFQRCHTNGARTDPNWQFTTTNGVSQSLVDTGMPFVAQHVYDFYIFCPPLGGVISWRVDDKTAGTSNEGSTSTYLPDPATAMRGGFHILSVDAVARNVRMNRVYTESKR